MSYVFISKLFHICETYFTFCRRFVSLQVMIANTMFRAVCYHPEEHLIITSGTDKKVDATPIKVVLKVFV